MASTQPMGIQGAIEFADGLLYEKTGQHLSNLQYCILQQAWGGKPYRTIARMAGYSEGHVKDVASHLWRLLSEALGERITKGNCRARLLYWLKRAGRQVAAVSAPILAPTVRLDPHEDWQFVGRGGAISTLQHLIAQGHRLIVIQGEGGIGKTTLAQRYLADFELTLELRMAKETAHITPVERVVEEWLRQDLQAEPGREFGVTLGRLKRQLSQRPVGILIDNLEPALDPQGQLLEAHRRYVELLSLLADPQVQAVTLITSRDRLCEPSLKAHHYRLPGLSVAAWQQYFQGQALTLAAAPLKALHQTYGGNAKAMEIICGTVQSDFAGDLVNYWQINQTDPLVETDLKNLIVHQVDRLQALDPIAYRGFCRLGCYRYQAIPELPIEAVCAQLWDVPVSQQRQVVASLRNRSLLETRQGRYWLHPAVRAVALERLQADRPAAHRAAADYWTRSISQIDTLADALQSLEAYYHYFDIQDYEAAAGVLLKSRLNQWQQHLPLTSSLYRMGLLQPVISALSAILPMLDTGSQSWELHNLLGDVYWITGQIHAAIACQERTLAGTAAGLQSGAPGSGQAAHAQYYLTMLNVDSHLSLGLYHIDLWELETAQQYFEQVIALTAHSAHAAWAEKASVALALVHSYQGRPSVARALAASLMATFVQPTAPERSGRFAYFIQLLGQTYSNLGDFDQAATLYHQAIRFADASHYVQVKAKAMTGLAEVYRQQGQPDIAQTYYHEALQLLEAIGAQCDLAETCYQLSLTYAAASGLAQTYRDRAISLFRQINAPRQIQKVIAG